MYWGDAAAEGVDRSSTGRDARRFLVQLALGLGRILATQPLLALDSITFCPFGLSLSLSLSLALSLSLSLSS
jgi:hypothetical protein